MDKPTMTPTPDRRQRDRKTCVLPPLRVSEIERETIQSRARDAGLSVSEYQRRACLNAKVAITRKTSNAEALRLLMIAGNNINQIARHLNGGGQPDVVAIDKTLAEFRGIIAKLV